MGNGEDRVGTVLSALDLDTQAEARLRDLAPALKAALPSALDTLYSMIEQNPRFTNMFANAEARERARDRQVGHWAKLLDNGFNQEFSDRVERIGHTHAKVGLPPSDYLAGYVKMLPSLMQAVVEMHTNTEEKRGRFSRRPAPVDAAAIVGDLSLLTRAVFADAIMSISIYQAQLDKRTTEAEAARDAQMAATEKSVEAIRAGIAALANSDFADEVDETLPEPFGTMAADMNGATERLADALSKVSAAADAIGGTVSRIDSGVEDLSQRTAQQAASLEESSSALEELATSVRGTAETATNAREVTNTVGSQTADAAKVVSAATEAMGKIEEGSSEITKIVTLIDEIAFQTNLLALNASVEAARAGEAGRGFAVVAQEVRSLAQRCAEAAKTITGLVSASAAQVREGSDLVDRANEALQVISNEVEDMMSLVGDIARSASEQSSGLNEVSAAVSQMDGLTQANASLVDDTNRNIKVLNSEAGSLIASISALNPSSTQNSAAA